MKLTTLLILALALPLAAQSDLNTALGEAKQDLNSALANLEKTRTAIAAERPEHSTQFQEKEAELVEKRRQVRIARQTQRDREQELRELQRDESTRRQDATYVSGLLKDQALRTLTLGRAGEPELQVDANALAGEETDSVSALNQRLDIIGASLDHLESLIGGTYSEGQVVAENGKVLEGKILVAGSQAWFLGDQAGSLVWERGEKLPRLRQSDSRAIGEVFSGQEAKLSIDVTGGKVLQINDLKNTPMDIIRKGGFWGWPIMALGLISFVVAFIKFLSLIRLRDPGESWVEAIVAAVRDGDRGKAVQLANRANHPASAVMRKLVENSDASGEAMEETLYEQMVSVQQKATSLLAVVAVAAATAPLLGLLGTVSGMIRTFDLITLFGSGDPKPLAGGISEALVTTLQGLIVAIPSLILHAFLTRRSQGLIQTSERYGLSFINGLRKP